MNRTTKSVLNNVGLTIIFFFIFISIRLFIIDLYYTPTDSMAPSIPSKSYLIVSKISYGAKLPDNTRKIPYLSKFIQNQPLTFFKNKRLLGFQNIKQNNIVLFDFNGTPLLKRAMGLPRDTVRIINGTLYINGAEEQFDKSKYKYTFTKDANIRNKLLTITDKIYSINDNNFEIELTKNEFKKVKNLDIELEARYYKKDTTDAEGTSPKGKRKLWTRNDYGPYVVPYKGMEIVLDEENLSLYTEILLQHENFEFIKEAKIKIEENTPMIYTFNNDYYFFMGDNRMESMDSRFLGVFPFKNILGRVIYDF